MKRYLISGLPPGTGGLGRFLSRLSAVADNHGWRVFYRPQSREQGLLRYSLEMAWFYIKLKFIRNARVVVLHPQTLRWRSFFSLARSNRMTLFVVDNSFFCIRSYNYRGQKWEECLDCLGDVSRCHSSCLPFPVLTDRSRNLSYLSKLMRAAAEITFLVQNPNQGRLVRRHFGPETRVRVVGMVTDEFEGVTRGEPGSGAYDVVFHGALNAAKGAGYAIQLARHLPELSFLLPGRLDDARNLSGDAGLPENVEVMDITWETGLREHVENCSLVLCPSVWSAPIEGALVKSILHNGRVAVFSTGFGYHADLPDGLVYRLDSDLDGAAQKVRKAIASKLDTDLVDRWIEKFLAGTDLDAVFR